MGTSLFSLADLGLSSTSPISPRSKARSPVIIKLIFIINLACHQHLAYSLCWQSFLIPSFDRRISLDYIFQSLNLSWIYVTSWDNIGNLSVRPDEDPTLCHCQFIYLVPRQFWMKWFSRYFYYVIVKPVRNRLTNSAVRIIILFRCSQYGIRRKNSHCKS